jgi:hypothetical protein
VYRNDEKICHCHWWRHCTRRSAWKRLNNSSKRPYYFHLCTELGL